MDENMNTVNWKGIHIPTSPALNPCPTPMTNPLVPNESDIFPFQAEVPLPHPTGFELPSSPASSPNLPTQATDIHRFTVPPTSQAGSNTERRAKNWQETHLPNGNSCRGAHKRNRPYFLENDRDHFKANKGRNEAREQLGPPPSVVEHGPTENPQSILLASSPGRQKECEYDLIQLLEASPQPMSKKAILDAIRKTRGLSESEWREFKANNTVNRVI